MKLILLVAAMTAALAGCATKQYPQAAPVSADEASYMDCQSVNREIAEVKSQQAQIDETGSFDGRTVLGVLGDFGIGNGMAKSDARKAAKARLNQLETLKVSKCAADAS
ncbi:hypothetical protein P3W43_01495 [Salinicola salarius]|uniref:hypothetical protein n=1 Tax=Salinicola salarius TaxID=430457 RepID=UPI0023E41966|nr:hypothetical protein [Salinicola salarius]MDF3917523.1 hypothetical protein [Salinicola salarius]